MEGAAQQLEEASIEEPRRARAARAVFELLAARRRPPTAKVRRALERLLEVAELAQRRAARIGWHVRKKANGRFQGRAYDPHERSKRAKSFDTEAEAKRWAKNEHALLVAGTSQAGTSPAEDLLKEYLLVKARRCKSADHVKEIGRVLRQAIAFGITDLRAGNATSIANDWLLRLRSKRLDGEGQPVRLSPRTENRLLNTLSAFGRWALRRGFIIKNPFAALERVEVPDELKPTFGLDELALIVDPRHADHPSFWFVASMVYLGIRQNEAANLDLSWFRWSERMVFVRGKRGKERLVPLPKEYERLLKPVVGELRLRGVHAGPLCPGFAAIHRKSRQRRFDGYLEHVGVDVGDRVPHSCRSTWISLMLATGEPQTLVQLYAGHDKVETTAEYAKNMVQYRRAVAAWPRGELLLRAKPKRPRRPLVAKTGSD